MGRFCLSVQKNFPECTYVIIDLPQTLLFSGVYLKTLFPNSRVLMYGGKEGRSFASEDFKEFDFILLPHYFINKQQFSAIDLAINMVSFQEMTSDQVLNYVRWLWTTGCRSVYSHNRSRSVHNNQLSDVGSILERGFRMSEISVLPVPYTVLETSGPVHWSSEPRKMAKQVIQSILAPARNVEISPLNYQHLFGYLHRQFKEHN